MFCSGKNSASKARQGERSGEHGVADGSEGSTEREGEQAFPQVGICFEWLSASKTFTPSCIALCITAGVFKIETRPASSLAQQSLRTHKLLQVCFQYSC